MELLIFLIFSFIFILPFLLPLFLIFIIVYSIREYNRKRKLEISQQRLNDKLEKILDEKNISKEEFLKDIKQ